MVMRATDEGKKKKKRKKTKKKREKKRRKKGKEGPKVLFIFTPEMGQKMIFHIRTVKRNRNEIEAQKIRF